MNSRVMTEYATGVSRRSVASRPPAIELAAAKPVSRLVFTSKGESLMASSLAGSAAEVAVDGDVGVATVCAKDMLGRIQRANAQRRGVVMGKATAVRRGWVEGGVRVRSRTRLLGR